MVFVNIGNYRTIIASPPLVTSQQRNVIKTERATVETDISIGNWQSQPWFFCTHNIKSVMVHAPEQK